MGYKLSRLFLLHFTAIRSANRQCYASNHAMQKKKEHSKHQRFISRTRTYFKARFRFSWRFRSCQWRALLWRVSSREGCKWNFVLSAFYHGKMQTINRLNSASKDITQIRRRMRKSEAITRSVFILAVFLEHTYNFNYKSLSSFKLLLFSLYLYI